jgi:hypothetical protein
MTDDERKVVELCEEAIDWIDRYCEARGSYALTRRIRAALSELGELNQVESAEDGVAEPEWLPIESAPKDGPTILVAAEYGAQPSFWNGRWRIALDGSPLKKPTHWLPLPPAPGVER